MAGKRRGAGPVLVLVLVGNGMLPAKTGAATGDQTAGTLLGAGEGPVENGIRGTLGPGGRFPLLGGTVGPAENRGCSRAARRPDGVVVPP